MLRSPRRRLVSSVAMVLAMACGFARADVLDVAPKDSLAVLKINHLGATNKKASDLLAKLGVAAMKPELADPFGVLKTKLGIKGGLNEAGDLGVVMLPAASWPTDPAKENDPTSAPVVILIPVSDYKAFIASFEGATTEGDITSFTKDSQKIYSAQWGDYAAVSPNKDAVAKKGEGVKASAAAAKELGAKDVVLWANVPALKAALTPQIAAHRQEWLDKLDGELKNNPDAAKWSGVVKALAEQAINAADTFLGNSVGATASLNLSDAGINIAYEAEFTADSYLGKWVSSLRSDVAAPSFTAGLPAGPYIFFGGSALSGAAISQLVTDFAGPVVKELGTADAASAEKATQMLADFSKMTLAAKETNFGMLAPRGAIGAESLFQLDYVIKGDEKAFAEGLKQYTETSQALMGQFGSEFSLFTTEYKPAAKTVDGVVLDTLSLTIKDPKTPKEAQMAQGLGMMYGPNGMQYQLGALDSTTGLMGICLTDANLSKLIASAKAGSDDLGKMPNILATTKALPEKPVLEFYFALDEAIRTGVSYAKQFGIPVNIQLPDSLPPIGFALATDGSTLRNEVHVPSELVQSLVAAYFQMMMGGGGGGGNGGL